MAGGSRIGRPGQFGAFRRDVIAEIERASLIATDRAARGGRDGVRTAMTGAGLGGLSRAIGYGSDLKKGRRAYQTAGGGFRTSGWVHIRGRSERTVGAIKAYTEGAEITPKSSRWLWISTDEIPRRAGRYRMTPALYNSSGLSSRIGPLVQIRGRHGGEALLIVRQVTVDRFGRAGKARRLPRRGAIGASREKKDFIVAFVGIRRTSRSARVDVVQIISLEQARVPAYRAAAFRGGILER